MNPFDYTKAVTDFWSAQYQALMAAGDQAASSVSDTMRAVAGGAPPVGPGTPMDLSAEAAKITHASRAMMELWSAATATFAQLTAKLPAADGDGTVEAVVGRIMDPRQWMSGAGEMDDMLGRMAEGPRLADLWQIERRYARVLQAWMGVRRRSLEHNAVMLKAWTQAGAAFMEAVAERTGADATALDSNAVVALWTRVANKQLLATQGSDAFLATQREMIRASTELRMAQQDLVEFFGEQYGFPTRTELDDVHRTVTELRRELRAMRREQRRPAALAPAPAADARPARVVSPNGPADSRRKAARS